MGPSALRLAAASLPLLLAACGSSGGTESATPRDGAGAAAASDIRLEAGEPYALPGSGTGFGAGGGALGDFNHDGHTDLALANGRGGGINILLNRGDGRFAEALVAEASGTVQAVASDDFDGDGLLDLVAAGLQDFSVTMLKGQGDGRFVAGASSIVGLLPQGIITADFNHDGHTDLAVLNGSLTLAVLLGQGDGRFGAARQLPGGLFTTSVASGDFDGDGHADLALADGITEIITVYRGTGDGSFARGGLYFAGGFAESIVAGDLNGDGLDDIVAGLVAAPLRALLRELPEQQLRLLAGPYGSGADVLLADGQGGFAAPVHYLAGTAATAVAIDDYDRDGRADIAVANFLSKDLTLLRGSGGGLFAPGPSYEASGGAQLLLNADYDGDGWPDLAVPGGLGAAELTIFRNISGSAP